MDDTNGRRITESMFRDLRRAKDFLWDAAYEALDLVVAGILALLVYDVAVVFGASTIGATIVTSAAIFVAAAAVVWRSAVVGRPDILVIPTKLGRAPYDQFVGDASNDERLRDFADLIPVSGEVTLVFGPDPKLPDSFAPAVFGHELHAFRPNVVNVMVLTDDDLSRYAFQLRSFQSSRFFLLESDYHSDLSGRFDKAVKATRPARASSRLLGKQRISILRPADGSGAR